MKRIEWKGKEKEATEGIERTKNIEPTEKNEGREKVREREKRAYSSAKKQRRLAKNV